MTDTWNATGIPRWPPENARAGECTGPPPRPGAPNAPDEQPGPGHAHVGPSDLLSGWGGVRSLHPIKPKPKQRHEAVQKLRPAVRRGSTGLRALLLGPSEPLCPSVPSRGTLATRPGRRNETERQPSRAAAGQLSSGPWQRGDEGHSRRAGSRIARPKAAGRTASPSRFCRGLVFRSSLLPTNATN